MSGVVSGGGNGIRISIKLSHWRYITLNLDSPAHDGNLFNAEKRVGILGRSKGQVSQRPQCTNRYSPLRLFL